MQCYVCAPEQIKSDRVNQNDPICVKCVSPQPEHGTMGTGAKDKHVKH